MERAITGLGVTIDDRFISHTLNLRRQTTLAVGTGLVVVSGRYHQLPLSQNEFVISLQNSFLLNIFHIKIFFCSFTRRHWESSATSDEFEM